MDDPWKPPAPSDQPIVGPSGYGADPGPYSGYAPAPYAYQDAYQGPLGNGPIGRVRPTGKTLLLFIVTFGIYGYVYNYQVHEEMKQHSGRGLGGGIALLLTFVAGVAMPFLTPSEVGALYERAARPRPVSGFTGLWLIVPWAGGYVLLFGAFFAAAATAARNADGSSDLSGLAVPLVLGAVAWLILAVTGGVVWLVKTNGALNRYWQTADSQPTRSRTP